MADLDGRNEYLTLFDIADAEDHKSHDDVTIQALLAKKFIRIEGGRYRLTEAGFAQLAWYLDHALDT